jgi:FMN reductase
MAIRAVAISGSPRAPSRSKLLAEIMLRAFEKAGCDETRMIDCAELPAAALAAREQAPEMDAAMAAVGEARIIIAATPTYRALYTGVLKSFFDLMPPGHLRGKVCIPIQTGGSPAHFLAIEYGLRPLFESLEGLPMPGVYATDAQFEDGKPAKEVLDRIGHVTMAALTVGKAIGIGV